MTTKFVYLIKSDIIYVTNAMPMNIVFIFLAIIYNYSNKKEIKDMFINKNIYVLVKLFATRFLPIYLL
jgi:hypothetical protein